MAPRRTAAAGKTHSRSSTGVLLYQRIRRDIESKILSGDWRPGYKIPFEKDLMAKYDCSRMTVNKVLAGLAAEGLIERRRRAGSFVARPRVQSAVLEIPDLREVVELRGEKYRYSLADVKKRVASRADRTWLGVTVKAPVLQVTCRHEAGEQPFAFEDRLINLVAVPEASNEDFSLVPPSAWLVSHVPWTQAEHRISAVNADAAMASELNVPVGSACLVIERWTWRNGEPITAVRLTHPGNLFDLVARFTPSSVDRRKAAA
jgi:GntR family histidine utilization transcriptional repressor